MVQMSLTCFSVTLHVGRVLLSYERYRNHMWHRIAIEYLRFDALTWDQRKNLELGNFGPSSIGLVQRVCTVKCKRDTKQAIRELIYFLYTMVDKCTPGMTSGTSDIKHIIKLTTRECMKFCTIH